MTANTHVEAEHDARHAEMRAAVKALVFGEEKELFYSILARIGDKWSVLTLGVLARKPARYTEILESVPGISRRMLTVTLRQLERDGLIERIVHAEVPPWVEYAATDLGRTLKEPLLAVALWALEHREAVAKNRDAYDAANPVDCDKKKS